MNLSSIWTDLTTRIETEQNAPVFSNILKRSKLVALDGEKAVISCENRGILIFLEGKRAIIDHLLSDKTGKTVSSFFQISKRREKQTKTQPLLKYNEEREIKTKEAGLQSRFSFEGFAVSSSNQIAYEAARRVSDNPGKIYNPFFIYGGVGCGKTHLIQAIGNEIVQSNTAKSVLYCTSEEFTNDIIENIRSKTTQSIRRKYRDIDVLIIDDVQFIAGKNYIQEEFYHTFNTIIKKGGHIILSSDKPPVQINKLEDRLRSRFSGGLTIDIQSPDFELRCAILLIKAKERGINIEMDAIKIIAERTTDTRELEGKLFQLYAKTLSSEAVITTDTVRGELEKTIENELKKVSVTDVLKHVSLFYGIKPYQLKEKTRKENIALPRQISMYVLRKYLNLKYDEIAFHLKRNDHTTILHGVDKIEKKMIESDQFRSEVDKIINTLKT